jgi:hypothetical protein
LLLHLVLHPCDPLDRFADQAHGHGPLTDLSPPVASFHGDIEDPFPVGLVTQGEAPPLVVVGADEVVDGREVAARPHANLLSRREAG